MNWKQPRMGPATSTIAAAAAAAVSTLLAAPAFAATGITSTWTGTGDGTWTTASLWSNGVPGSAGDTAIFGDSERRPALPYISLYAPESLGQLTFNNSGVSYTILGGASDVLTMDNNGQAATITDLAGSHLIGAPVALTKFGLSVNLSSGAALRMGSAINGSGGITVNGPGTLTLTGQENFAGATVNSGTLILGLGPIPSSLTGNGVAATGVLPKNPIPQGVIAVNVSGGSFQVLGSSTVTGGTGWSSSGYSGFSAVLVGAGGTLLNSGTLIGGAAAASSTGGAGGAGVTYGSANAFNNSGTIQGGDGGVSIGTNVGGAGGNGLLVTSGASITNSGTITGGDGATGGSSTPSAGGFGVSFSNGGSLTNSGTIGGGAGGSGAATAGVNFAGAAGTLVNAKGGTITGGVTMGNFANNVTLQIGSTITGNLNLGSGSSSTLTLTDDGSGGTQTYAAAVTGSTTLAGSLVKAGSGTWVFTQGYNFTGPTTISAGTLQFGDATSGHDGSLATSGLTDNAALVFNQFGNESVSYPISGTGTLTKNATGTLTLLVDNSFSGGTTINAGTLQVKHIGSGTSALGAGPVTVNTGGTLTGIDSDAFGTAGHVAPPSIAIDGGTVTDLGTSSYRITLPSLTFTGGTLTSAAGNAGDANGNYSISGSGSITTLASSNTATISAASISLQASTTFTVASGTTTSGVDLLVSTPLSLYGGNSSTLTKAGPGLMEMTGANTYTTATTISGGTLQLGNGTSGKDGSLATSGINDNAALVYDLFGSQTAGYAISGTGTLTKAGGGTLTLTGSNTFTGGTTVNGGTLVLGNGGQLVGVGYGGVFIGNQVNGGVPVTVGAGGTLQVLANGVIIGGDGVSGSGSNTGLPGNGGAGVATASTGPLSNAGTIQGGAGGSGVGGSGVPGIGGNGVSLSAAGSIVNTGSILAGNAGPGSSQARPGGIGIVLNAGGSVTNSGSISGGTGYLMGLASGIAYNNAAGTLVNQKGGTIGGGVTMGNFANSVTLYAGSSVSGGLNMGTNSGATLTLTDDGSVASQTYSSAVSGGTTFAGSLLKTGGNAWVLDQPMTFTGGTTVNGGTLVVTNTTGSATGTGTVTLNAGTLASGSVGTIGGNVLAGSGSHAIAPGGIGSVGNLTLGGLTTSGNTTLDFDLGSPVSGSSYNGDLITFTGAGLTANGGAIAFGSAPAAAGDYRLFAGSVGSPALANLVLPASASGFSYALSASADPGYVDLVVSTVTVASQWSGTGGSGGNWSSPSNWPGGVPNGAGNTATFGAGPATPQTVNLDAPETVGQITFNNATASYTVSGSNTLTLDNKGSAAGINVQAGSHAINTPVSVANAGVTVTPAASTNLSIGGVVSGTGGLTLNGPGTLTLTAANTYTGGTRVNLGTLVAAQGGMTGTFAAGSAVAVNAGGTLQLNGTDALGYNQGYANLAVNGGTVTLGPAAGNHTTFTGLTMTGGTINALAADGAIYLNGPLTTNASPTTATITAPSLLLRQAYSTPVAFTVASGTASSGVDLSISSAIADGDGSHALVKAGPGVMQLGGINTYSGGTQVTGGTLMFSADANLGAAGTGIALSGGARLRLNLGGGTAAAAVTPFVSPGGVTLTRPITLADADQFDGGPAGTLTLAGTISGPGQLQATGGTVVLAGTNSYAGGTLVAGATLGFAADANLGDPAGSAAIQSGTLQYTSAGSVTLNRPVSQSGGLLSVADPAGILTLAGSVSGRIEEAGAGTLVLTGANSGLNAVTVDAGTLAFTADASLGSASEPVHLVGGTLQLNGASAVTANRSLDLRGAATVAVADPAGVLTVAGVIAQSGGTYGLAKAGPGTLVLTGGSSYTGATTVSAGTLQLGDGTAGHDGSLATGGITNNATLAFNLNGSQTVGYPISGTGSLTKAGPGTLTLTTDNAFSGGTTVAAGTLQVNTSAAAGTTPLGSGAVTVNSGATLVAGNADAVGYAGGAAPASIAINGGTVTDLGSSNYRVTLPNLTFTGGTLTGAAGNAGDSFGVYSLYGNGTAVSVTTLASSSTATISGGSVSLEEPTTFDVAAGTTASGVDLLVSARLTPFAGFAPDTLTKVGNGTMVLTAANTYVGATTITAGTLQLGDGTAGHDGSLATSGIAVGASLVYNLNGGQTASYPISGSGSLTKAGPGTLTLTTDGSYAGGTTVNGGTLQVYHQASASTPLGSGTVTVNAGATLVGCNGDALGYAPYTAPQAIVINGGTVTDLGTSSYRLTLPNLTFTGGTLTSAAGNAGDQYGNFSLYGDGSAATVTTLASSATATISGGSVALEVPTTFNVAAGTTAGGVDLLVGASVIDAFNAGVLTKAGTGTMVLSGSNTYTGGTTVNGGTLTVGTGGTLGAATGPLAVNNPNAGAGTAVVLNLATGADTAVGSLSGAIATPASGANTATINTAAGHAFTVNQAADGTYAGTIAGPGSLVKAGPATLTLTADNGFSGGTTVNAGTLQVNAGGTGNTPLGSGPVTVNSGATLVGGNADAFGYAGGAAPASIAINGGTVTNLGTSNYRVTLPSLTFNGGTLTSAAGNAGDQYGTFSLLGNGSTATVTTLASSTTAAISGGSVALEEPTTFNIAAGNTGGADLVVSAPLTPFGGFALGTLTKTGDGVMVLAGTNTYAGSTTINAGTLRVNGSTLRAGTVRVAAGGTLGGSGSVGSVVVDGTITAGPDVATTGTLTTGTQTWDAGGQYAPKAIGAATDQLLMSGLTVAATASSPFTVNVTGPFAANMAPGKYVLAVDTAAATPAADPFSLSALTLHLNGAAAPAGDVLAEQADTTGFGGVDLVLVAAPEPASLALLAAAAAPLALGRRRRQNG